ncbi:hypothetical protein M9458_037297, partial [Cirrhinus mrigala]
MISPVLLQIQPSGLPSLSSCCTERMPEPTTDGEPETATTEKAVASDFRKGRSAHCNIPEGELVEDLGLFEAEGVFDRDLIDLWADLPPLLPPSS